MKHEKLRVASFGNGQDQFIDSYFFAGSDASAPSVYIQANIHGAENQGNAVIAALIETFKKQPPKGSVELIPMVNPLGINQKVGTQTYGRYHPSEGENYNRGYYDFTGKLDFKALASEFKELQLEDLKNKFKTILINEIEAQLNNSDYGISYNQKLCMLLQQRAHQADIVLDLHCDTHSLEHVYAAEYEVDQAKGLNFPVIYSIPEKFGGALDEACFMPWVALCKELKIKNPVLSFTLELGDEEVWDSSKATVQTQKILNLFFKSSNCSSLNSLAI